MTWVQKITFRLSNPLLETLERTGFEMVQLAMLDRVVHKPAAKVSEGFRSVVESLGRLLDARWCLRVRWIEARQRVQELSYLLWEDVSNAQPLLPNHRIL